MSENEDKKPQGRFSRFVGVKIPTAIVELRGAIAAMGVWQRLLASVILTGLLGLYIPQVASTGVIAITGAVVAVAVIMTFLTGTLRLIFTWIIPASLMFFVYPFAALPVTLVAFFFTVNRVLRETEEAPED